ncbi:uncharacterized protein LOC108025001 [Drosophila biarmipes]|uniref:uncharacterized protein LOC108025001 n=1 Tax=Drosophila biarmipes TaxID=125945 RepID=UPI0007E612E0|nr:uncharacterized protein LOC108025001 [Drosophila biarmipes]
MCPNLNSFVKLLVILYCLPEIASKLEFTNIQCVAEDTLFCSFEYCYIKPINRSYKYISLKARLFKTPLNFAMYKRVNGYLPFLYNKTVDSCRFLNNTSSQPVAKFFYELFKSHSNMNHSCPYDHDIVIDKLSTGFLNHQLTEVLPLPEGKYMMQTRWFAYDILRASESENAEKSPEEC